MALLTLNYKSEALGMASPVSVLIPERPCALPEGRWPTLYLLHGLSDDETAWMRYTALERYVKDLDLCVIMPNVHRSFYTDMMYGERHWTFVSQELPELCERLLPITTQREHRYALGLSMGGYGAFKLGLRCPDRFAAVASLSGAVDMLYYTSHQAEVGSYFRNAFGTPGQMQHTDDDLPAVARRLIQSGKEMPRFYMACGTEDFLYQTNQAFLTEFQRPLGLVYEEKPGNHTWDFWDEYLQKALRWMGFDPTA